MMNDILGEDFPFSENILDGKTALVCGASRGIGRSPLLLLGAGARVIACARNKELLEELVSEMHGSGHEALVLDLEDTDTVRACADSLADRKITILINNAGGPPRSPLLQNDLGTSMDLSNAISTHRTFWSRILHRGWKHMVAGGLSTSFLHRFANLWKESVCRIL